MQAGRRPVLAAVLGWSLVAAYSAVGAVQILVWNPLAAAPDRSLTQIRADLDRAGEQLGEPWVFAFVAAGLGIGIAVLAAALAARWTTRGVIRAYLVVLALGAPAYWAASFSAGMSLADTYGIGGGDHAPWGAALGAASAAAFLALGVVSLPIRGSRPVLPGTT
ncbi:MAG TPA: hypothetical protein VIL55_03890 [Naasia sp.]